MIGGTTRDSISAYERLAVGNDPALPCGGCTGTLQPVTVRCHSHHGPHLNSVRAGMVKGLRELRDYPWTGHGVIIGRQKREWQDVAAVLAYFGQNGKKAVSRYEEYVGERIRDGRRPELVGGGLIRSLGGWSVVLSMRARGEKAVSDERILGSGEFIERVFSEAEERVRETLGWRGRVPDLPVLLKEILKRGGVEGEKVLGGDQRRSVVKVRKIFCREAVKRFGYSGARVARFLGVTTSLVNRYASSEKLIAMDE